MPRFAIAVGDLKHVDVEVLPPGRFVAGLVMGFGLQCRSRETSSLQP